MTKPDAALPFALSSIPTTAGTRQRTDFHFRTTTFVVSTAFISYRYHAGSGHLSTHLLTVMQDTMEILSDPAYCTPPPGSSDGTQTPSQVDLHRAAVLARPVIWRLSSLDNMLEHRKAHSAHKRMSSRSLPATLVGLETPDILPERISHEIQEPERKLFRGRLAEFGFCFSMAVTQLVAVRYIFQKRMLFTAGRHLR